MTILSIGPNIQHTARANSWGGGTWQNDQYQNGTQNPQKDYEIAQRMQFLKGEMDRIAYALKNCDAQVAALEQKISYKSNENYQLNTQREKLVYDLGQTDRQLAEATGKQARIKEKLHDPYYKSEWGYLSQERYQVAAEISNLQAARDRQYWAIQDLNSKIQNNQNDIQWAQNDLSSKKAECQRNKYEYDTYAAEYQSLRYK